MIQECRAKYYYPGLARKIQAWVTNCPDFIADKRIDTRPIRPNICNTEFMLGPEVCLEVDKLPNLRSSNGYKHIVTLIVVFSRYLFAFPTQHVPDSNNSRTLHCRNVKEMLPRKSNFNWQRIVIQIRGSHANSANSRHTYKPRVNKTWPNN